MWMRSALRWPALRRVPWLALRSPPLLAALLCAAQLATVEATPARASLSASLSAKFVPMHLGGRTTLEFGFAFTVPSGQVPTPLTQIELRYPSNLGLGISGLGLATCTARVLETSGPAGCSPNAVMGFGTVLTGIVLGTTIISESAPITILRSPGRAGHLALLFFSEGTTPVNTRIVFPGLLLPAPSPFGGLVEIGVPLVPTLPGAPYISVIHLRSTIGPRKVLYYEQVDGRTLAYRPLGILLPPRCPRGGFPFAAQFRFFDGSVARAHTAIVCHGAGQGHPSSR